MTRYELWTMNNKKLVGALKNACRGLAEGKPTAPKAVEVFEGEILRRLAMLTEDEED